MFIGIFHYLTINKIPIGPYLVTPDEISSYLIPNTENKGNRYNLKIKIFKSRYLFVKKHLNKKDYAKKDADLLIAPSWNSSFFKLECHKILRDLLINNDITYKIRPHPMSYIKEEISKKDLLNLGMKIDSQYIDFNKYNFFISDWSGLFINYPNIGPRKSYLINQLKK